MMVMELWYVGGDSIQIKEQWKRVEDSMVQNCIYYVCLTFGDDDDR